MVDQPYSSKQLSDSTPIANMTWGELKEEAMKEDYEDSLPWGGTPPQSQEVDWEAPWSFLEIMGGLAPYKT